MSKGFGSKSAVDYARTPPSLVIAHTKCNNTPFLNRQNGIMVKFGSKKESGGLKFNVKINKI